MTTTRKYKRKRSKAKTGDSILYVLLFELEGKQLVKIGITSRSISERVVEILSEIFQKYRIFPHCNPRRFSKTSDAASKEKELHKLFKDCQYSTKHKFGGYTEFFDAPVDKVTEAYDDIIGKPDKTKKGVFFSRKQM